MKRRTALALLLFPAVAAAADWSAILSGVMKTVAPEKVSALSDGQIVSGLKEALAQGTTHAITTLGRTDGFWANGGVRIPLPDTVSRIEGVARKLGGGERIDQFHLTLNRAAEQAVPEVAGIFGDAVRQMSVADARGILRGPKDAATQYFRRTAGSAITAKMRPIVQAATQKVGVTAQYKKLVSSYGSLLQLGGVKAADLDDYVTGKAMDGLFTTIAGEEARIRENPAARSTEILKKVFGAAAR